MKRLSRVAWLRALLVSLAVTLAATPLVGQQPSRVYRLGYLTPMPIPPTAGHFHREYQAFEATLRERGYVLGKNLAIEYRTSDGHDERLPVLVNELLRLKVDVLLTYGSLPTRAAQSATKTTPIVMVTVLDPISAGFVSSLAHPGGNITGCSEMSQELAPKRLELIKELLPSASVAAVLWDPAHPTNKLDLRRTEIASKRLGLTIHPVAARDPAEFENAFTTMRAWNPKPDALVVLTSGASIVHAARILELANRDVVPTIYGSAELASMGALLGYGPDFPDQSRHAALLVDAILKGAKPGDLPVRQPTKYRLAVNLRTAKVLGLTVPESLLLRADEVIR